MDKSSVEALKVCGVVTLGATAVISAFFAGIRSEPSIGCFVGINQNTPSAPRSRKNRS
jgi:hypothetical protein